MNIANPIYPGGTYDIIQTVFKLSRLSSLGADLEGSASDIQLQLGPKLDDALTKYSDQLGVWTRVWGPCVFQADQDCSGHGSTDRIGTRRRNCPYYDWDCCRHAGLQMSMAFSSGTATRPLAPVVQKRSPK